MGASTGASERVGAGAGWQFLGLFSKNKLHLRPRTPSFILLLISYGGQDIEAK